jgi:hypothetical protein
LECHLSLIPGCKLSPSTPPRLTGKRSLGVAQVETLARFWGGVLSSLIPRMRRDPERRTMSSIGRVEGFRARETRTPPVSTGAFLFPLLPQEK